MSASPMIIDVDTGVDDAIALALAVASGANLIGVTTVAGNVPIEVATRNTRDVLAYLGATGHPGSPGREPAVGRELSGCDARAWRERAGRDPVAGERRLRKRHCRDRLSSSSRRRAMPASWCWLRSGR